MFLNAQQMLEAVRNNIDYVSSPRFEDNYLFQKLNEAQESLINNRGTSIKNIRPFSAQSNERIRTELSNILIRDFTGVAIVGNTFSLPANHRYTLRIKATIDGKESTVYPTDYNRVYDSFDKPTAEIPYYNEHSTGIDIEHNGTTLQGIKLSYFRKPQVIDKDSFVTVSGSIISGATYFVDGNDTVTYNGTVYGKSEIAGRFFTGIVGITTYLGTGLVYRIYNSELNEIVHFEICKLAAGLIEGEVEQFAQKSVQEKDASEQ